MEAVDFCRNWMPHRNWLISNKKELSSMEEEVKYQTILKAFPIKERALNNRFNKAIEIAAQKFAKR